MSISKALVAALMLLLVPFVAGADCLVDQQQTSWNSTSGGFRWQSFTADDAGFLCQVDVNTADAQTDVTIEIYQGEGTLGALLHTQVVDLPVDVASIVIDAPVNVAAAMTYTIHFPSILTWRLQTGNPYPGGVGSINPDVDYWFRSYVDPSGPVSTERGSWGALKAVYR